MWEGESESTESPDHDHAEEAMLTQPFPHWQGDSNTNGEVMNGENTTGEDYDNINTPYPPLAQGDNPRTHATSQYDYPPHNGANPTEEDPFVGGKTRGALRPEDNLSRCLMADASNGFNKLSRIAMLWMVTHRWLSASMFAFNCYRHYLQLLIRLPGYQTPNIILI